MAYVACGCLSVARRFGGALAMAIVLAAVLAACGSSSSSSSSASNAAKVAQEMNSGLIGGLVLNPPEAAPPLALRNYTGAPVSLAALQGKAVFVTFVYTHCPNVCPLIISNLAAAQRTLAESGDRDVRFIAVTVDPRRDTAPVVRSFLTVRGALGRVDYLLGTRAELAPVWKAWHVTISLGSSMSITHSSDTFGVSASGKLAIVLPSGFNYGQIVHDAVLLAHS